MNSSKRGPRHSRGPLLVSWVTRLLSVAGFVAVLVLWRTVIGPVALGGPATFAVVSGSSMEPTYQDGDLVIGRVRESYGIGDIVIFPVEPRRVVIHRIAEGDATEGWITRGDNNDRVDSWRVPDRAVLGEQWVDFPGWGKPLRWTQEHPLLFGLIVATVFLLGSVLSGEISRRRLHPLLRDAIRSARRGSRMAGRPPAAVVLYAVSSAVLVGSIVALTVLATVDLLAAPPGVFMIVLGLVAAAIWAVLLGRLGGGWGVEEPLASRWTLSAQCWEVDTLPLLGSWQDCSTRRELRALCEKRRLPVLRKVVSEGVDVYATITRDGSGYRWSAVVDTASETPLAARSRVPLEFRGEMVDPVTVGMRSGPVPASTGVYGWWFDAVPPGISTSGCAERDGYWLLYVGVVPLGMGTGARRSTLRSRIRADATGTSATSPLRLRLAEVLVAELGVELRRHGRSRRMTLGEGEALLSDWISRHGKVTLHEGPDIEDVAERITRGVALPLGSDFASVTTEPMTDRASRAKVLSSTGR